MTSLNITILLTTLLFSVYYLYSTKYTITSKSSESSLVLHENINSKSGDQNPVFSLFDTFLWAKLRVIYYVNNWIYTTNHKRIAVNYYWFVIFSGICGMVLATIIRLEMAYPGVGILAGDSLQYLSVVTAHAVIMVFFMIMPLLFGAFGNFLLPTQLGVHDVAFPRLNSAAFWFLPAGLLMLVQLVCLDRRYQRMNCYNIREIQTILKSKYSPNTSAPSESHTGLNDTIISLRYTLSALEHIDWALLTYYKNAILQHPRYRAWHDFMHKPIVEFESVKLFMSKASFMYSVLEMMYEDKTLDVRHIFGSDETLLTGTPVMMVRQFLPVYSSTSTLSAADLSENSFIKITYALNPLSWVSLIQESVLQLLGHTPYLVAGLIKDSIIAWGHFCTSAIYLLPTIVCSPEAAISSVKSYMTSLTSWSSWFTGSTLSFSDVTTGLFTYLELPFTSPSITPHLANKTGNFFSAKDLTNRGFEDIISSGIQEQTSDQRFMRSMNPVFKYDFKVGNYMPDDAKKMNPHLMMTIKDITTGIRKSSWYTSEDFTRLLQSNVASHLLYFTSEFKNNPSLTQLANLNSDLDSTFQLNAPASTNVSFTGGFYNFFILSSSSNSYLNSRWVSVNALDQKYYRMFATASMQQRIHANWRQLKFTREAWRCKLLAARHQNTLYKRYLSEDSVVWAVERNAKDVLPGWAMITPFSARARFTAIGKVDLGLMGVFLVLNSSIVSSANFLVTYRYLSTLNNRKMRDARSFFTEGVMVASWMMIAANPMLAIGILMLLSDRHWQTSFFDYSGGGDTVLFQHMFWFFGHPEVYVIMIPAFGFNNTILSFYLRKRVSARASLLYSMYTIAFLGFFVWGHHMYMVGLAHTTRMLFSTLTVMISVPAATKLMHWCVTLVNSTFVIELPMLFQLLFIFFFVSGGISGMAVAHTGMDILFHDSFYVVGHFHVMLAGSAMFASFGAFYFYFPAIFGVKFSRLYGYLHCLYYLTGQLMTVVPMFWLGYAAMPRRVLDYPAALGGWHAVVSAGHMLSVAGMMAFFIMIFDSIRQGRAATRNSFGVARFNTRLNFYIYEGARTWFLQRKGWFISRFNRHNSVRLNGLNYQNNEYLETTLYSYVFLRK